MADCCAYHKHQLSTVRVFMLICSLARAHFMVLGMHLTPLAACMVCSLTSFAAARQAWRHQACVPRLEHHLHVLKGGVHVSHPRLQALNPYFCCTASGGGGTGPLDTKRGYLCALLEC